MKAASAGHRVWVECAILAGLSALLAALVSFSRIYLGDHYPDDVLSGALSGMAFAESVQRVQQAVMPAADSDIG